MATRNTDIRLKRSNVIGKIPTIGQLELGQVALNTADAKLYTEYTGGATGATEVREIGWNRVNITGDTMTGDLTMAEGQDIVFEYSTFGNFINTAPLTANRNILFPDADGTLALLSDINNTYTTGTTLVGTTLYFDRTDSLSAYTADLSLLSTDTYLTGQTFTNDTLISTLNDGSTATTVINTFTEVNTDILNFNTGYTGDTIVEGRMYWDEENQTVSLGLHNGEVSLQLGQELHYLIKNQSGATIENGRVVRATGTLGSSGRILGEYMIADGSIPAKFTLGIATENILNGDDGYVTEFGLVRGINTTGVPYGETWNNGDVLWVSSTIPGGLTNVEPISPNLHIEVAIVIDADTKGSIFVRPHRYPYAHDIQDMGWSGGTENNLDVIQWDSALGYFNLTNTPNFNSLSATTISGGTFFGDGSNLTGVISTTGGTYTVSGATLSLDQSDGSSVSITGVTGQNFANTDLTLTGNRTHDLDGNTLTFDNGGIISINPYNNSRTNIGYGTIGGVTASWATLSHINYNTTSEFGFAQGSDGTTHINSSEKIVFKQDGVEYVRFTDSGTTFFGTAPLACEKISLQEDTLIDGELVIKGTSTPVTDGCHIDNSYSFYIDGGELKGRYKDNLGVVTDLTIGTPAGGLISIKDSNGVPTYYTDLQTAIDATATIDTIYIHSDIELTSTVDLPTTREKITFVMNGYRIWGDTTSGDFNLFETGQNASLTRTVNFEGGGVVETVGTCSSVTAACPWNTNGSQRIRYMDLGTTTFRSENAQCFRAQTAEIRGGILIAPNSTFYNTGDFIGTKFEIYESSPNNLNNVIHCDIYITYGSWYVNQNRRFSNNVIRGTTTKSGNNGLIYGYAGSYISNNTIIMEAGGTTTALFIRGSGTDNKGIRNNYVVNLGSSYGAYFVYGSSYNNYCYSLNSVALYMGGNCREAVGNTAITNATTAVALGSLCDYTVDNTAICYNTSHTGVPLYVGGTTNEVFNNKAICYNASTPNIQLASTGTIYLANNIMSSVGSGLDLNGNSNAMTNTPDAYGNLKIG